VYALTTGLILHSMLRLTGGRLIYALDDPYITMAMARNLAAHGVWGITPYAFSSACSSPVFLLILALLDRITGPASWTPLWLSWSFGAACLVAAHRMLRRRVSQRVETAALAGMVLLTPLFVVGTLGMEHSLHLLLCLVFLALLSTFQTKQELGVLCGVTALMCGVRYEGLLLVAVAALILIWRRRWLSAAALAVAGWLPVLLYAAFSIAHGGTWLPNSVALKGFHGAGADLQSRIHTAATTLATNLYRGSPLALLLLGLVALLIATLAHGRHRDRPIEETRNITLLFTVIGATALHLLLADVGWAFRYEDYLIGCGIVVAVPALCALSARSRPAAFGVGSILGLAVLLLGVRASFAANLLPRYAEAISLQQARTAEFLARYYPGASIAAGDVGLINFRNDLHCLDLTGLASTEVFEAKRSGRFTTREMDEEAKAAGVQIAIVYDTWFSDNPAKRMIPLFGPSLPPAWTRVGRWTVPETLQLGDRTVSFYAVDPGAESALRRHLREFGPSLPKQVQVSDR
jgi:hypothetical protein